MLVTNFTKKLKSVFLSFNKSNLNYSFLRGYSEFLEGELHNGQDIDIVLNRSDIEKFKIIIYDYFNSGDYFTILNGSWSSAIQYRIVNHIHNQYIILDVRFDYTYHQKVLIYNKELLRGVREYKGINILSSSLEVRHLLYHVVLKSRHKDAYLKILMKSDSISPSFIRRLLDGNDILPELFKIYPDLKSRLEFSPSIFNKIKAKISSTFSRRPPLSIVLMGPDGSGKSTVGIIIQEKLTALGVNSDYFHYARGKDSMSAKHIPVAKKTGLHNNLKTFLPTFARNVIRSLYKLYRTLIFLRKYFKYTYNYFLNTRRNYSRNSISIVDRCPLSMCITKKQLDKITKFKWMISFFFVKPTKIYMLHTEAHIINSRKKELTIEQIVKYMQREEELVRHKNIEYNSVDSSLPANTVANLIVQDMLLNYPNTIHHFKISY